MRKRLTFAFFIFLGLLGEKSPALTCYQVVSAFSAAFPQLVLQLGEQEIAHSKKVFDDYLRAESRFETSMPSNTEALTQPLHLTAMEVCQSIPQVLSVMAQPPTEQNFGLGFVGRDLIRYVLSVLDHQIYVARNPNILLSVGQLLDKTFPGDWGKAYERILEWLLNPASIGGIRLFFGTIDPTGASSILLFGVNESRPKWSRDVLYTPFLLLRRTEPAKPTPPAK